ncbi:hypothetical protein TNCV_4662641 [Trichonephila clavipes]|uniref:Uncharacterized protein n=1 Tax=Trichonephila clavipes TaxID=2585209 RepID=A0A8X6SCU5_TRICX|nr:hypothetical protein TNCV_4662641 [Trichonephila clavipes]
MPKEVEELVFVWASRLSPYPWVRFDYPFPFVIRSKNRGELQCLLKQNLCLPHWTCSSSCLKPQPPGQPIGVTVHSTQQPIREHLHSSKPRQKLLKIFHPDEAQKPRLPDPIVQPIAVMPLSRT